MNGNGITSVGTDHASVSPYAHLTNPRHMGTMFVRSMESGAALDQLDIYRDAGDNGEWIILHAMHICGRTWKIKCGTDGAQAWRIAGDRCGYGLSG